MTDFLNDSPIDDFGADRYHVGPFARALARCFLSIAKPLGTTIALHGPWGSGKSSIINLMKCELVTANDEMLVVSDFKCWWFRGEEALVLAFMQELNATLKRTLGDQIEEYVPKIAQTLLQAGPTVGPVVAAATANPLFGLLSLSGFATQFFKGKETVEDVFGKLSAVLQKQDRRFLIIIDDIDRLTPDEAIAIFRMVKSVGRLPNVMYLLVFDRELADKAVAQAYPSEGPHFLEKIIQVGFELPMPLQTDLNEAILSSIEETCGSPHEDQIIRVMNVFYDAVVPYLTNPRDVARFRNAISFSWPAIASEISVADFIVLETLRLYEPLLFRNIRSNKEMLCGIRTEGDRNRRTDARFDLFLRGVPERNHEAAKLALMRIFPRLEEINYSTSYLGIWDAERRVCVSRHFDTYFRLALSEDTLSTNDIVDLIEHAADRAYVQEKLRRASKTGRKGGQSMVPVYLDELTTHARKVPKGSVEALMSALFEIHDEIDLEKDAERGFMSVGDTSLRFHWLIRQLTADRFTLDERTQAYLAATERAALGWLVDFVSSARNDHREQSSRSEDELLVAAEAQHLLTVRALQAIEAAAQDGSLLRHKDLMRILYGWRDFAGDPQVVRDWTQAQLLNDEAVVTFARGMTGESRSLGMGGFGSLGDRVSQRSASAQIDGAEEIVDIAAFKKALERIDREARFDAASLATVRTLLNVWERGSTNRRKHHQS